MLIWENLYFATNFIVLSFLEQKLYPFIDFRDYLAAILDLAN